MPLMSWDSQYSIGNEMLDDEHRKLFEMVNTLNDSLDTGSEQDIIREQLLSLAEHARQHFDDEETLMERAKFPGLGEHRIEHEDLTARLLAFKLARAKKGRVEAEQFATFLHEWLTTHIMESDKAYAVHLQQMEEM
jgi:hemerythrin